MMTRPLIKMPYANAKVIEDGAMRHLISYTTHVASYNTATGEITVTGLYSATTRKHISAFAWENGRTYADFKNAYLNS